MIDYNIQYYYIRCLIDQINPEWIEKCNFVSLYNNKSKNYITTLYITDDGKKILYITNKIFVLNDQDGKPWAQKFEKYLKHLFPKILSNTLFSYSGLYFNEFKHDDSLSTLSEYMRVEPYNPKIICGFLDSLINILKYHLSIFCFSETLFLVDKNREEIFLPSYNYVVSIAHPIPEELFTIFKYKLHPIIVKHMKTLKVKTNNIANTGMYNPSKMKQICIRLIEKSATTDRAYLLSSIIYYFATIGTLWKLQKQWSLGIKKPRQSQRCFGLCSHSRDHTNINLKKIIHDYVCIEVVNNLPVKLKKSSTLYTDFIKHVTDLQNYLLTLN